LVDNITTDVIPEPCSPNDSNAELTALLLLLLGCVPDLLVDNIITDGTPEPCSPNYPNAELTALLGIRTGMQQMLGQQVIQICCYNNVTAGKVQCAV
jgi:hypothetical protein